ncbi:MAG: OB-fold domain-containing protein [Bordetella sp.]|nr:OB-fold domain-containing protein [Bordetella sp.]
MTASLFAPPARSARQVYLDGLRDGQLLYQYDELAGMAVFYPREVGPSGEPGALVWRRSEGRGSLYAWTVIHARSGTRNIALVDLDEGFRMMATVQGVQARDLRIGQRLRAAIERPADTDPRVVFEVSR